MAQTIVGMNDAKAVKRYSGNLAVDVGRKGYFTRKYMSKGEVPTRPIQQLTDLELDAGEQITYDLSMQLNMVCILKLCPFALYMFRFIGCPVQFLKRVPSRHELPELAFPLA